MSKFCSNCGTPLEDNARFCPKCGTPSEGAGSPAPQNQIAYVQNPQVQKSSVDGIKEMFFVSAGRLNRKRYFLRGLLVSVIVLLGLNIMDFGNEEDEVLLLLIGLIIFGMGIVSGIMLGIRRCHDFGKTGYFILLQIIPIIGFFAQLYILFKKGDEGPNQYGPDPLMEE